MPTLTAAVLAAFVGYAFSWYIGLIEGNFALLLFMATNLAIMVTLFGIGILGIVRAVKAESREARERYLFFAFAGAKQDGRRFAEDALRRGAMARRQTHYNGGLC